MPRPRIGVGDPQRADRLAAEHRRPRCTPRRRPPRRSPTASRCPRLPGPCVTIARSAPSTCRAASSPVCTVTASRSPPNACPTVTTPASERRQRVQRSARRRRQRPAVLHHVGDPQVRVGRQHADQHRRQRRVQVGDDHGHAAEVVGLGHQRVVLGVLLVDARRRSPAAACTAPSPGAPGPVGSGGSRSGTATTSATRRCPGPAPAPSCSAARRHRPAGCRPATGRPAPAAAPRRAPRRSAPGVRGPPRGRSPSPVPGASGCATAGEGTASRACMQATSPRGGAPAAVPRSAD